jgi:hypothetical protein
MASSVYISKAVEIGTAIFCKSKRRGSTNTPQITPLHLAMSYWYSGQSTSAQIAPIRATESLLILFHEGKDMIA